MALLLSCFLNLSPLDQGNPLQVVFKDISFIDDSICIELPSGMKDKEETLKVRAKRIFYNKIPWSLDRMPRIG